MSRGRPGGDPRLESDRFAQVQRLILGRAPEHEIAPTLARVAEVMNLLGDPQHSFRAVHVGGTNGKTSTARMIDRLLREHGLRTGLLTSPHLISARERVAIDGEPIGMARFVEVYDEVAPYLEIVDKHGGAAGEVQLSFFEVLTIMGFAALADAPVDVGVIEVGMGGQWDATNVVNGEVAVLTPIGIDHERYLGHGLASIATEKAGIIKAGSTAVIGEQSSSAMDILLARAAEVGAVVARAGLDFEVLHRDIAVGGQQLAIQGLSGAYHDLFLPLHGGHQAANAACALAAVEVLLSGGGAGLDERTVRAAFAGMTSPGRLEIVRRNPTVLVDAAHNPAGAAALVDAVHEEFTFERLVGLVGVMEDKDAGGILDAFEPIFDEIVISKSSSPRAMSAYELGDLAIEIFGEDRVHLTEGVDNALDFAISRAEAAGEYGGGVLVTGSISLVGDVRRLLGLS